MTDLKKSLLSIINNKTKPPGSLGMLEAIALQIGLIQQSTTPQIKNPHILVFAGDHGIAATGLVNPYPQAVTAQMVLNFLHGGAAINVFCRQHHIQLKIVDAGVNYDFAGDTHHPDFIDAKINRGTKNYLLEPAMTKDEAEHAISKGKDIIDALANSGCNTIGFGEMGIGNTSSAALLMSAIAVMPIDDCVGRGTGVNDEQLEIKKSTLQKVYARHADVLNENDPISLLSCIGGFEIAMMTGSMLQAAKKKMIIVVDGFISTAALLVARLIDKEILSYCVFAHTSGEQGHEKMLDFLKVKPVLHLGLRLGEGTGAALAIPLIQSAVNFLNEMASFESAGVATNNTNNTNENE